MRSYQLLDTFVLEGETARLSYSGDAPVEAIVAVVKEGERVAMSFSIGPLELALRLPYPELKRNLSGLQPVPGLTTTRHMGTGQADIAFGMNEEGGLVMRPSLITDASGHLTLNLTTTKAVFESLTAWLNK